MATKKTITITLKQNATSGLEAKPLITNVETKQLIADIDRSPGVTAYVYYNGKVITDPGAVYTADIEYKSLGTADPRIELEINIPGTISEPVINIEYLVDNATFIETLSWVLNKYLTDAVLVTENFVIDLSKIVNDNIVINEILSKEYGKYPTETVTVSEMMEKVFSKVLNENASVTESLTYAMIYNRVLNDTLTVSEALLIARGWSNLENVSTTDVLSYSLHKVLWDYVYPADNIAISGSGSLYKTENAYLYETMVKDFSKVLSDSGIVSDTLVKQLDKVFNENVTVTDSIALGYGKFLSDLANVTETLSKIVDKKISDSLSASDSLSYILSILKTLSDNITVTEGFVLDFSKVLGDNATVSESISKDISKYLFDTLTATDNIADINTGGGLENTRNDAASLVDTIVKSFNKVLNENPTTISDSGLANSQNYVNAGYTAEDYVGTNYTF